jgi:hypothetical protein
VLLNGLVRVVTGCAAAAVVTSIVVVIIIIIIIIIIRTVSVSLLLSPLYFIHSPLAL